MYQIGDLIHFFTNTISKLYAWPDIGWITKIKYDKDNNPQMYIVENKLMVYEVYPWDIKEKV